MYIPHFVSPFIHQWILELFLPLGYIMNNAAMNMGIQISLQETASSSLGYIPTSGLAGLYGNSKFIYLFSGITILFPKVAATFYIPVGSV